VDDNVDYADLVAMALRLDGHTVLTAHDGASALEAAAQFEPHAVLLDIGLPKIDGYMVARRLRANATTRAALLVAISGYGSDQDRRLSRAAGIDRHLVKPVGINEIRAVLAASGLTTIPDCDARGG
jgi:DNA-binding response OmpR family regulator